MNQERLLQVLLGQVVSEKSTAAADAVNQHVFKVRRDADKTEVRAAIESLFNVKVKAVRTVNVKGKRKRFGRSFGRRSDWKKAYVALEPGYDIELGGGEG